MALTEEEKQSAREFLRKQRQGNMTTQPSSDIGSSWEAFDKAAAENIARQRLAQQASQPQKQDGLLTRFAKGVLNPFGQVATSVANIGSATGALIRGEGAEVANQKLTQSRDLPFLGETEPAIRGDETFGEGVKKIVGTGLEIGSTVAGGGTLGQAGKAGVKGLIAQGVKQGAKGGLVTGAAQGTGASLSEGDSVGQALAEGAVGGVIGGATGGVFGGLLGTTSQLIQGKLPTTIKKALAPKRLEEVLATPESQVHKLNPTERQAWFKAQELNISEKGNLTNLDLNNQKIALTDKQRVVEKQIRRELQDITEKTAQETEALKRQLAVASRDKVIELRPKIIKAMGDQSKAYRKLVDEAMAGKESLPIKTQELKDFVDSRFAEDPAKAAQIKDRLGLTEQVNPLSSRQFGENVPTKLKSKVTLGEIYNQTKNLKQDLSASKVFTAEDKLTDEAINTLSSYLKNSGVDLQEANKFWAKYAPIRDELVAKANPFNKAGTQTKGLADVLVRVAKESDVNSENFIKETEKLLGEPITKESKAIFAKMSTKEKDLLAKKIAAELRLEESKMATELAIRGLEGQQFSNKGLIEQQRRSLSDRQFEVERQARIRGIVKKIIYAAGIYKANDALKKHTGIGI